MPRRSQNQSPYASRSGRKSRKPPSELKIEREVSPNWVMPPVNEKAITRQIEEKDLETALREHDAPPETVYKYMTHDVFSSCLKEDGTATIRATPIEALNDIAEGIVDVWPWPDHEGLRSLVQSLMRVLGLKVEDSVDGDPLDYVARCLKTEPSWLQAMFKTVLSKWWGVMSFSAYPLNLSMWGTYAADNTGFVVGYNTAALCSSVPLHGLGRIQYLDHPLRIMPQGERLAIHHDTATDSVDDVIGYEDLGKILFFKSKDWLHEHEVRLLVSLESTKDTGCDPRGHRVQVVPIAAKAISHVIHGPKTPRCKVDHAKKILRSGEYTARELYTFNRRPGAYGNVLVRSKIDAARAS